MIVLYINHFIISETLYALDLYHLEMDTSLLKYYFWLTVIVVILLIVGIAWLFGRRFERPHQLQEYSQCKSIIETYGGNYLSHLIYSGDKDVFMYDSEQAFLCIDINQMRWSYWEIQLEIRHHSNHCWLISIVMLKS